MFDYRVGLILTVIMGVLMYASMGEWLVDTRGRFVFFRKRPLARVSAGMGAVWCFWFLGFAIVDPFSIGPVFAWICVPFFIFLGLLAFWGCGPADISIDLEARMCHATRGWIFCPKTIICPLTDSASVVIVGGGQYVRCVWLWTQSDRKNRFCLALTSNTSDARRCADDISRLINVPVR